MTETNFYHWLWDPVLGSFGSGLAIFLPLIASAASIYFGSVMPRVNGTRGLAVTTIIKGVILLGYLFIGIPMAPTRMAMLMIVVVTDVYAYLTALRAHHLMQEIVALRFELERHGVEPPVRQEAPASCSRRVPKPRRA